MATVLVTGINGFVGKHLTRELIGRQHSVLGIGHKEPAHPEIADKLAAYYDVDVTDASQVNTLPLVNIDAVVSLAGLANVGDSFNKSALYKHVNVAVLQVLGEAFLAQGYRPRIIAVSTGAVYKSGQPLPLTEDSIVDASSSPYTASKLLMEKAAVELRQAGLDCVVVRPFNHIGPGQVAGFLLPDLYDKINAARSGGSVKVGNLKTRRDYTDVRDIVRAYADLATVDSMTALGPYNICSNQSRSGQELLDVLLEVIGLRGQVQIEIDKALFRPHDPIELLGSYDRLRELSQWQPIFPFAKTIRDYVAWRQSN